MYQYNTVIIDTVRAYELTNLVHDYLKPAGSKEQRANWVAVDVLRRLGQDERAFSCNIIETESPEVMAEITKVYGHYLPFQS